MKRLIAIGLLGLVPANAFGQYLSEKEILDLFANPQQNAEKYNPPLLNDRQTEELFKGRKKVRPPETPAAQEVPPQGDLRRFDGPIRNQQELPWCTAFASLSVVENISRQRGQDLDLSEHMHFQDYREYTLEGAARSAQRTLIVLENAWPYKKNPVSNWRSLGKAKSTGWSDVDSFEQLYTLVSQNKPVILGVMTTNSWNNPKGGVVSPSGRRAGGHAIAIVGYNKSASTPYLIFRNSWGSGWGDKGYGYLPVSYCRSYDCSFVQYHGTQVQGEVPPTPTATPTASPTSTPTTPPTATPTTPPTPGPTPGPTPPPGQCNWLKRLFGWCE